MQETEGLQPAYPFTSAYDYRGNFNLNSHELTIPTDGVYFFSLSAGVPANRAVDFSLTFNTDNRRPAVLRTHTTGTGIDTMSREAMFRLLRDSKVLVRSGGALYSDAFKLTSMSAFSISDTMTNPEYFYVYQPDGVFSNIGRMVFQQVLLNNNNGWNPSTNTYRCPQTGVYVFSFSLFVDPGDIVRSQLHVGNKVYELLREHTMHGMNGGDVLSRTVLSTCNQGESVYGNLTGGVIQGRSELTTGLMGFAYTPDRSKATSVYWSMSRNTEVVNDGIGLATYLFTRLDEASFGLDVQRSGNLYSAVRCPASGWYYVHLTAITMPDFRLNLFISVGGQREVALFRSSAWQDGAMDYMSRSAIIKCASGTLITVEIAGRQAVGRTSSSQNNVYGTTFLGFMLYTDNTIV